MIISALQTKVTLGDYQANCVTPWTYTSKYEDRIFSGVLAERYPVLILADGATSFASSSGAILPGGGADAATVVCQFLIRKFDELLQRSSLPQDLESLMEYVALLIEEAERSLEQHNAQAQIPGATTVLVALLYGAKDAAQPYSHWVYGYLGDGDIVLMSPGRRIKNWPAETWLLTPHKLGDQPVLLPRSTTMKEFRPLVGCIPYHPGDILYAATDGISFINQFLGRKKKLTFGQYLWRESFMGTPENNGNAVATGLHLPNPAEQFSAEGLTIVDDVCVGAIWTEVNHD